MSKKNLINNFVYSIPKIIYKINNIELKLYNSKFNNSFYDDFYDYAHCTSDWVLKKNNINYENNINYYENNFNYKYNIDYYENIIKYYNPYKNIYVINLIPYTKFNKKIDDNLKLKLLSNCTNNYLKYQI